MNKFNVKDTLSSFSKILLQKVDNRHMLKKIIGIQMKKWLLLLSICISINLFGQQNVLTVIKEINVENSEDVIIEKINGGLTNENFKVTVANKAYFFRVSNNENSLLNNSLEREWQITKLISAAGIGPKVIHYSPLYNILVTDFIETKKNVDLRNPATIKIVCNLINSLHRLQVMFPTEYEPIEVLKKDVERAKAVGIVFPSLLEILLQKINCFHTIMPKVPTHLDLHAGNILDQGEQMFLIDWEYAAMSDPFFDLATSTSAENFSDDEMQALLQCYLERNPTVEEINYFYKMRILADARWAVWCFIQAEISTMDEPFEAMGNSFLEASLSRINLKDNI